MTDRQASGEDLSARPARVHLDIHGGVQGVGFRYATLVEASRLDLRGWVRNRFDESVEVVAEGPRDRLERLVSWCRIGPRMARVTSVEVAWEDPEGLDGEFQVRATR
jgi:acylphosphatase